MTDRFESYARSIAGPARSGFAVEPDDDAPLPAASRALYVGGGGDIALQLIDDAVPVLLADVPGGSLLPLRVAKVLDTGTTASGIVALL